MRGDPTVGNFFTRGLVYTALSTSLLSSLGFLLVPSIAVDLHIPVSSAQWMVTINLMVGAVSTPIVGRLADGAHTKRLLLVLLWVIVAGSVIAATSVNFGMLLLGRAMQGLSFAIIPVAIALMRRYELGARIERGIAALSVTALTGLGIGYPLTGLIASLGNFRVAFWFAAVFVLTTVIVVWGVVPADTRGLLPRSRFDFAGAALLGLCLASLLVGISEGPAWGWASLPILGCFAAAAILLVLWAIVEIRTRYPLVQFSVLRHADVLLANATAIGAASAIYMGMTVISIVAQAPAATGFGLAMPLVWAGFIMAPSSLGGFFSSRLARQIAARWSWTTVLPVGATIVTSASFSLWLFHAEVWQVLLDMFLLGVGIGMVFAAMPALIARKVPAGELGSAVSFNAVLRTMGGAIGSAIVASILASHLAVGTLQPTPEGIASALLVGALTCAAVTIALFLNAGIGRLRPPPRST